MADPHCWQLARLLAWASLLALVLSACTCNACCGPSQGTTVHVVFANHYDAGFTASDDVVLQRYFFHHFPRAVDMARRMRTSGTPDRFIWTTQPHLLSLFFDCSLGMGMDCPNAKERAAVEAAVRRGDISWHAMAFNVQFELMDIGLLEYAVDMVHELDVRFNKTLKKTVSLRDVPGMTRAAIPVLARRGVRAISFGINAGSAPPAVPKSTPFVWRDPRSGAELIAMVHPGGYGGWNHGVDVGTKRDCVRLLGFDHVLCYAWRCDNAGPPMEVSDIEEVYSLLRDEFPGAHVKASTFDAYTDALLYALETQPDLHLPMVTGEMGDTWIYGVQSDPHKVSSFRAAARARSRCLHDPTCDSQSYAFRNFSRLLLKVPEHTWGLDIKLYLADFDDWSNSHNARCLANTRTCSHAGYDMAVDAWERQHAYVRWALEALPWNHPVRRESHEDWRQRSKLHQISSKDLRHSRVWPLDGATALPAAPVRQLAANTAGPSQQQQLHHRRQDCLLKFESSHWVVEVDTETGALHKLARRYNNSTEGNDWAAGGDSLGSFGQLVYNVYSDKDYQVIWDAYAYDPSSTGFVQDLSKWNLSKTWDQSVKVKAKLLGAYHTSDPSNTSFLLHLEYAFPRWLVQKAGAPKRMWMVLESSNSSDALQLTVVWQNKAPTRLPEALWLRFRPGCGAVDDGTWALHKLGSSIHPHEVMLNGSLSMHAVDDRGVSVASLNGQEMLHVRTLDTALVSPGWPTPFPNPRRLPDLEQGVAFNLVNNVWGTNYVQWVPYSSRDVNATFRFVLHANYTTIPQHTQELWLAE